jgi:twin arginine-targeting protein translocase, TatA/E family
MEGYYYNAFGWIELILLFLIIIILFGSKKLPELARGLGEAVREFRKAMSETESIQKQLVTSPQTSYQHSQYQEDPLITAAKSRGINVEGKTRLQIVEELAQKIKEESSRT